ncbi:MAG: hypothetical protein ACRC1K_16205, partial [Planctomycetia bacterium]
DGAADWSLAGKGADRRLVLRGARPWTGTIKVRLGLFLPAPTDDARKTLAVPEVAPVDAEREVGQLLVAADPSLEVAVRESPTLARTSREQYCGPQPEAHPLLNGAAADPVLAAYRYAARPVRLAFDVARRAGRLNATVGVLAVLEAERVRTVGRLRLTQTGAPLVAARVQLPAGFQVNAVDVPGDIRWAVVGDDPKLPVLELERLGKSDAPSAGAEEAIEVRVDGWVARAAGASVTLPTFEAVGAVQQTGSWVAAVPPGLDAETEQTVGLAPTAPEQIDWLSQEAAQAPPGSRFLAYRQDRRPASLTLRLRRLEPRLRATGLTVVSLRETSVAYITQLNWTIEQAGVSRLVFSAPDWLGQDLDVQGAGVRQVEPGPAENGRRRFVVALDREILGRYTLHLVQNLPLPADANLRFPRTTAEGVEAFDAFAVLQNLSPDQLDRRDDPALKVEAIGVDQAPAGLSPFVRRTAMEVFRLVGTAGELSWRMRSSEKVEALSASVNLAELVMVVEADRRYRAQANYRVANRNEQFLTLEFPEDCQVWSVFVAGQPARPARSMRDG